MFLGEKPATMNVKPPVSRYGTDVKSIAGKKMSEVIRMNTPHCTMYEMYKSVSDNHKKMRSKTQGFHNFINRLLRYSFYMGNHSIMHPATTRKNKLSMDWTGLVRITEGKLVFIFDVEILCGVEKKKVHARRLVAFPEFQFFSDTARELQDSLKSLRGTV